MSSIQENIIKSNKYKLICELENNFNKIYERRFHSGIHNGSPFGITLKKVYNYSKNEYMDILIEYCYEFVSELILQQIIQH